MYILDVRFFFAQICYHCDSTSGFIVSSPRHGRFAWWISEMPTPKIAYRGGGRVRILVSLKNFFLSSLDASASAGRSVLGPNSLIV